MGLFGSCNKRLDLGVDIVAATNRLGEALCVEHDLDDPGFRHLIRHRSPVHPLAPRQNDFAAEMPPQPPRNGALVAEFPWPIVYRCLTLVDELRPMTILP